MKNCHSSGPLSTVPLFLLSRQVLKFLPLFGSLHQRFPGHVQVQMLSRQPHATTKWLFFLELDFLSKTQIYVSDIANIN